MTGAHNDATDIDGDGGIYRRLQTVLLATADVHEVLTELAQLVASTTAGEVSCGITLRYDTRLLTVGSSDERAGLLDETQYRLGAGPCLHSLETGSVVDVADLAVEPRWPEYRAAAADAGLRCSVSFPLVLSGESFGAMNVYGFDQTHMFDGEPGRQLQLVSAQAAGTLRIATRRAKDSELLQQLEEALSSRTVIDQAMGIIMARHRCTADTAFELMRQESRNTRRRLRDIAHDLVVAASDGPAQPGRPFNPT